MFFRIFNHQFVLVIVHKISNAIVAPTSEVMLLTSNGGETSTTSAPIKFKAI